jgi:hypothetical protein
VGAGLDGEFAVGDVAVDLGGWTRAFTRRALIVPATRPWTSIESAWTVR